MVRFRSAAKQAAQLAARRQDSGSSATATSNSNAPSVRIAPTRAPQSDRQGRPSRDDGQPGTRSARWTMFSLTTGSLIARNPTSQLFAIGRPAQAEPPIYRRATRAEAG